MILKLKNSITEGGTKFGTREIIMRRRLQKGTSEKAL